MSKKITLTDIANRIGSTPSTVQRALNDMPGVSDEKRKKIKKIAEEMGYQRNVMAKMLRTKNNYIAVILPEPTYYSQYLWDGVKHCLDENAAFDFTCYEYKYNRSPENLADKLEEVFNIHGSNLSGVLTMGEPNKKAREIYKKWMDLKVPVVFVGTESSEEDRLCCSRVRDEVAGKMAADLLLMGSDTNKGFKTIITGDFSISDQYYNMLGFESVLVQQGVACEIIKLSGKMEPQQVEDMIYERIKNEKDITSIYSTSARNTVSMCKAIKKAGLVGKISLIGSDLFPESKQLLEENILNVAIHKRPNLQAFEAGQALINYIVYEIKPESTIYSCPVVVTKSNMAYVDDL